MHRQTKYALLCSTALAAALCAQSATGQTVVLAAPSGATLGAPGDSISTSAAVPAVVTIDAAFNANPADFVISTYTTFQAVGNITTARNIKSYYPTTVDTQSFTLTMSGKLEASTTLTKIGSGVLVLTSNGNYGFATTISAGTVQIGDGGTTGTLPGENHPGGTPWTPTIGTNGTLSFDRSDTYTYYGSISGSGNLKQIGSGTLVLAENSSFSGLTTVSAGTLQLGAGGNTGSVAGDITIESGGVLAINHSDIFRTNINISGAGSLRLIGTGTTVLTGTNTYTGGTTIAAGTLVLGAGLYTGSIVGDVTIGSGAALHITRHDTFSLGGNISGAGSVSQRGDGTTILTGTNSYTGGTLIEAGTLQLGAGGGTGSITGNVSVGYTSIFAFNRSDIYTFGGDISGIGGVRQMGPGTTILTGTNTYTGGTVIAGGTLQIGNGGTTGSLIGPVAGSAALTFDRSDTYTFGGNITGSGTLNQIGSGTLVLTGKLLYSGLTTVSAGQLQLEGGNTVSIGGVALASGTTLIINHTNSVNIDRISGAGSLHQIGTGTTSLTGTNTYTGDITISAGKLVVSNALTGDILNNSRLMLLGVTNYPGNISGSGFVEYGGGTTVLTGTNSYTGGTNILSGSTLQLGAGGSAGTITGNVTVESGGTLAFNRSDSYAFGGDISGYGSVRQMGPGTTILTGTNTYTGGTVIAGGTLQIGNGGTTGSLIGPVAGSAALTFDRSDTYTFAGDITGSGTLNQIGSGTLVLTGNLSYTGLTTVSAGQLQLEGGNTVSIGGVALASGTALVFNRSAQTVVSGVSGAGSVRQIGTGTTILTGANTYTGGTTISAGVLEVRGDLAGNVIDNGTLRFAAPSTIFAGAISGSGNVVQASGTTVLTGTNSYTGGTSVTGGTLQIGGGGNSGTITGNVAVAASTVLAFNRSDASTFGGDISGSGAVRQMGSGTTILTGTNTYTGGTVIAGGTLQIGNGGTTGSLVGPVAGSAALTFNRSDTYTFAGTISGSGTLNQIGSGTLLLTAASSFTGLTTVSAGTLVVGDAVHQYASVGGDVTVASGATLRGYGRIVGGINNSGKVMPGNSIGTLFAGSFTQASSGTFEAELSPTTASRLQVSGPATLAGTLALDFLPGDYASHVYTVLSASSISGRFASIAVASGPAEMIAAISQSPTEVDVVTGSPRDAQAYGAFYRNTFAVAETLNDMAFAHVASQYCQETGQTGGRSREAECPEVQFWIQPFAGTGSYGGGTADHYGTHWTGAMGGIDVHTEFGLGLSLISAYAHNGLSVSGDNGHATTDSFYLALDGGLPLLGGRLDVNGHWMAHNGDARRTSPYDTAVPKSTMVGGAVQYALPVYGPDLTTVARLSYTASDLQGFEEKGNSVYRFAVKAKSSDELYGDFKLAYSHVFQLRSGALFVPDVSLGVRSVWSAPTGLDASIADAVSTSASIPMVGQDRWSFIGGLGVKAQKAGWYALFLHADTRISHHEKEAMIKAGAVFDF